MTRTIAGIVLAGGRSRRMGRDKAQLPYNGKPLIDHMINCLKQVPVDNVLISGDVPGYDGIPDRQPDGGPARALADIITGDSAYDGFLIVPVDMPALGPEPLRLLLERPEGACYQNYPLPAYIPACRIEDEVDSMRDMLDTVGVRQLDLSEDFADRMINVNTPDDWQAFAEET